MYGRKRNNDGGWEELGTYFERFESRPPQEIRLSKDAQSAFQMVARAIAETATAQDHRNSGRRIYSGCGCKRCRRGHVIDFPAVSHADRLAA